MSGIPWSDTEVADAQALSWEDFHEKWPERPWDGWRYKARMIRTGKVAVVAAPSQSFEEADPEKLFRITVEMQRELEKIDRPADVVDCQISTDAPIGVAFVSDGHIGEIGTDLELMDADFHAIAQNPGLYAYIGGDMAHNFILSTMSHFGTMDNSAIPPRAQRILYERFLSIIGGSVVAIGTGNHDFWTQHQTDIDTVAAIAKKYNLVYTGHGGLVNLKVGSQTYRIYRRHKARFNSSFNLCHTVKSMWRFGPTDFDVGVVEHGHIPALETFTGFGKEKIAIRTGTYLTHSAFADEVGAEWRYGTPVVVFHPDEFRMIPFSSIKDAALYLGE